VQKGDGGEYAHYVLTPAGVVQLAAFEDKIIETRAGPDGGIFALSLAGSPNGKILKLMPPFAPFSLRGAAVIVPESNDAIELESPLTVTRTRLLVRDIVGGPNQVRIFDHGGKSQGMLPLPEAAAVGETVPMPDGSALYSVRTYLRPRYVMRWNAASGTSQETKLVARQPYAFDDVEIVREFAISKDGTRVPLNILRKKGTVLDGANPTILYGYGGYAVSEKPYFLSARERLWFDGGGIFVFANIRGGGDYGERWHLGGNLTKKQNVFDDFFAAARHLIDRKYTSSEKLAIFGESNGGMLMGATLTQHPGLARAVVSRVGIYDMLRVELGANGEFNITEFGSVKDPEQFKALFAYSPYHHVVKGTRYPAVLMTTGANDGRVEAWHSRKFTAALQAASISGLPVLLYTTTSGHGMGSSRAERIEEHTDILDFLYDQLGMTWREAAPH
jgi:prolyl oligopeptidase